MLNYEYNVIVCSVGIPYRLDLLALREFSRDIPVHINLIEFNPVNQCGLKGSSLDRREEFARCLKGDGFKVTHRYSLGADIEVACGQLAQRDFSE